MAGTHADGAAVRTERLGKRFGRSWALARLDLAVAPGEVVLLAGPNGSGKTTLLRLVAGLYRPTRGRVAVFGHDPRVERLACRRMLSLVSHDNYLYPPLTALEMLRLWARLLGRPASEPELHEMLEQVGLARFRHRAVGGFSAGMRKRLTLLRIRLEEPRLVLLDEPLAALDAEGKRMVERWIAESRAAGRAALIASHAVERMAPQCDRAVLLRDGQLAWSGAGAELPARLEAEG